MNVLGIDTSTRTGYAVVSSTAKCILVADEIKVPKGVIGMDRCIQIANSVGELLTSYPIDAVVIENYGFANSHTLVTLVEIGTLVRMVLWQNDRAFLAVPPTTLKKFVTGKGNSKKNEIMMHVFKKWGFEAKTDNVADAVGLAMFGLCITEWAEFTKAERATTSIIKKSHSKELALILSNVK